LMMCLGKKQEPECQNGDTKMDDCNSCFCLDSTWACTEMMCPGKKQEQECTAGDPAYWDDCNTCICSGGRWVCTTMLCPGKKQEPECSNGDTKMMDCNNCVCAGGYWACTMMLCPSKKQEQACVEGETKEEDCNNCICSGGTWACTMMLCVGKKQEPECRDGDTKMMDCNSCFCMNGHWGCTLMGCAPMPECLEGETKEVDCNTCTCMGGTWSCTLMMCGSKKEEPECQVGDTKMEDCNTCSCGTNGVWACTMMFCGGKKEVNREKKEELSREVCIGAGGTRQCFPAKREESCTLGDSKKLDCNSCTCAGFGHSTFWMCTMMNCATKREIAGDSESTCVSAGGTMQCFPSKREEPECETGDTKKEDCNDCICAGGVWACTMMFCLDKKEISALQRRKTCVQAGNVRKCFERRSDGSLEKCSSGRAYKIDCNWCICQGEEWLCTLKHCVSNLRSLTAKVTVDSRGMCTDEEVKMKDCNTCVCIGGEWMCTLRMCRAIKPGKREEGALKIQNKRAGQLQVSVCQNEAVKRKDCNVCVCMGNEWMCTQRMCKAIKPIKRSDEEEEKGAEEEEEKRAARECSRGEKKMDDCNRCICLAGNWACTLKFCN